MKKLFYIDFPQEKKDPKANIYRCYFCKEDALKINGLLDNHKVSCKYRLEQEALINGSK